jgi:3,4-dihydroxyphenylacetate 2,3-dioxygenase
LPRGGDRGASGDRPALPHFIKNMPYEYPGNPALGQAIADVANELGVGTRAHADTTLDLEYGTLAIRLAVSRPTVIHRVAPPDD